MRLNRGLLINLEGAGAVGKTTALDYIEHRLEENDIDYLLIRNHSCTDTTKGLRELLAKSGDQMDLKTQVLLYTAIWHDLLHTTVRPALAEGKVVVMDRYIPTTFFFQAELGVIDLFSIIAHIFPEITDLSIYVHCDIEEVKDRLERRKVVRDDRYNYDFVINSLTHLDAYVEACKHFTRNFVLVDTTTQNRNAVADECYMHIQKLIDEVGIDGSAE